MPADWYALPAGLTTVKDLLAPLNAILKRIALAHAKASGADGQTVTFTTVVSHSGQRITKVAPSVQSSDAVTRAELDSVRAQLSALASMLGMPLPPG